MNFFSALCELDCMVNVSKRFTCGKKYSTIPLRAQYFFVSHIDDDDIMQISSRK